MVTLLKARFTFFLIACLFAVSCLSQDDSSSSTRTGSSSLMIFPIEYTLQTGTSSAWVKRGSVKVRQNTVKRRLDVEIINDDLTTEFFADLQAAIAIDGLYTIKITSENSTTGKKVPVIASVPACYLVGSNLNDKFVLNFDKQRNLMNFSYNVDPADCTKDVSLVKNKKTFSSQGRTLELQDGVRPIFPASVAKQFDAKGKVVKDSDDKEEPGFFRKYWWIFAILFLVMNLGGGGEAGQQGGAAR